MNWEARPGEWREEEKIRTLRRGEGAPGCDGQIMKTFGGGFIGFAACLKRDR